MPTFLGKAFNTYFKNILGLDQDSNTGVDSSPRRVQDGAGNNTPISLSDTVVQISPVGADSTRALGVRSSDGSGIFRVDTTNRKVLIGESEVAANTQYAQFKINYIDASSVVFLEDTHYAIPFNASIWNDTAAFYAMGSSTSSSFNDTNPVASYSISTTAMSLMQTYWYVMDDITIDAVKWLHAADTATGDSTAAHLMSYTVDIANGSTSGNLSSGTVVAGYDATSGSDSTVITNAGYEQIYYQQLPIQSADVDAGKVIIFTFASDTVNSDYSINATVKYHIR